MKNSYSHHSFVFKCLIPICIYYLFEFKCFNYIYKTKKKKNKITSPKKKKTSLPHVKATHSYPEISIFF